MSALCMSPPCGHAITHTLTAQPAQALALPWLVRWMMLGSGLHLPMTVCFLWKQVEVEK